MKFIFDECMAYKEIVQYARKEGFIESDGIPQIGMAGWEDDEIATWSLANNWVVVTNNTRDFVPLYKAFQTHPGLVCLKFRSDAGKKGQMEYFERVLDEIDKQKLGNLQNKIVTATLNSVKIT